MNTDIAAPDRLAILRSALTAAGAIGMSVCPASPVSDSARREYEEWLAKGHHAGMEYMERNLEVRYDPRLLLPDARSVISLAFGYADTPPLPGSCPAVSLYALRPDYHDTIRQSLRSALRQAAPALGISDDDIAETFRICVDSAPIMERYWAVNSGLCTIGRNGAVILPGYGSYFFLAEIVTTLALGETVYEGGTDGVPNEEEQMSHYDTACDTCRRCLDACPAHALGEGRRIDCRRCLSYLTIEHRGEWTTPEAIEAISTPAGRHTLFGCDRCLSVCPLNKTVHSHSSEAPHPDLTSDGGQHSIASDDGVQHSIASDDGQHTSGEEAEAPAFPSVEEILSMDAERFARTFRGSPIKRAKLAGLLRNARHLLS